MTEGSTCSLHQLAAKAELKLLTSPHPARAKQDAEALLQHTLGQDRAWLIAHWDDESDSSTECAYTEAVNRRQTGEPLQYITGQSEFFGLPFSVGPGVLIPRPETEHLVEEVLRLAKDFDQATLRIADIGTGSAIIAVALAHMLPQAHIAAVDSSAQALTVARDNAKQNQVEDRIDFFEGDLFQPLSGLQFQIIASNPPYIPTTDHDSLSVEVRDHEPHSALFAGEDGLGIYQRLIPESRNHLVANGWLALEIGFGQQQAIESLLASSGFREISFVNDYQQIPRVALACKR
jgi:release factor glutamine methyltransferase